MDKQHLGDNIAKVRERIRAASQKSGRNPADILLLAVSKTRSARDIRLAHACGLSAFGESYVQEAVSKIAELSDLNLSWHFIGPIQSNKTRDISRYFDWVHSVDRLKIAQRLSAQRPEHLAPIQICVQVNISGEASKSGVNPQQLPDLMAAVARLPRLQLRGLMAVPAPETSVVAQHAALARLRQHMQQLNSSGYTLDTLSMGMSNDLEAAIEEGSNIVRIGTAIFGRRDG